MGQAQWSCRMSVPAPCLTVELGQKAQGLGYQLRYPPQMPGFLSQAISVIVLDLGQPNQRPARLIGIIAKVKNN